MSIRKGMDGRVCISSSSKFGNFTGSSSDGGFVNDGTHARDYMHTILQLTNWELSQPGPAILDATNFGDEWVKNQPSLRDGGTLSFSGYFDWADSTGQRYLSTFWANGTVIKYPSSVNGGAPLTSEGYRFELWPSTMSGVGSSGGGMFKMSTAAGSSLRENALIIQDYSVTQDKSGLGTISMTMKISDGFFSYTTKMQTTNP